MIALTRLGWGLNNLVTRILSKKTTTMLIAVAISIIGRGKLCDRLAKLLDIKPTRLKTIKVDKRELVVWKIISEAALRDLKLNKPDIIPKKT